MASGLWHVRSLEAFDTSLPSRLKTHFSAGSGSGSHKTLKCRIFHRAPKDHLNRRILQTPPLLGALEPNSEILLYKKKGFGLAEAADMPKSDVRPLTKRSIRLRNGDLALAFGNPNSPRALTWRLQCNSFLGV